MAKILDKKEQVFDLEITPHGKYLLSTGKFKPVYYGFYDDNVLYDGEYAGITEAQSQIQQRIKEETVYLGTLTRQDSAEYLSYYRWIYLFSFCRYRQEYRYCITPQHPS